MASSEEHRRDRPLGERRGAERHERPPAHRAGGRHATSGRPARARRRGGARAAHPDAPGARGRRRPAWWRATWRRRCPTGPLPPSRAVQATVNAAATADGRRTADLRESARDDRDGGEPVGRIGLSGSSSPLKRGSHQSPATIACTMPTSRASSSPTTSASPRPCNATASQTAARRSPPRSAARTTNPPPSPHGAIQSTLHGVDPRARRPAVRPRDERLDGAALALRLGLDARRRAGSATQPDTPSRRASSCMEPRNQTPCTRPVTTTDVARAAAIAAPPGAGTRPRRWSSRRAPSPS